MSNQAKQESSADGSGFLPVAASDSGGVNAPVRVCAWHEGARGEELARAGVLVSHGMCPECHAKALAEIGLRIVRNLDGVARVAPMNRAEMEVAA